MSRRNKDDNDSGSGVGIALVAGLIGIGIGAIGAFFASKFADKQTETVPPIEQLRLPQKPKKKVFTNQEDSSKRYSKDEELQQMLICPISLEMMDDPVTIPDCGHTFDRATITPVLNQYHACPLCRKPANTQNLIPNYQLKNVIEHYQSTRK